MIDDVAKGLDLNPNRFNLVAALLGSHILSAKDLGAFHLKIVPELKLAKEQGKKYQVGFERVIRAVVNYVRAIDSVDDYETIGSDVFGSTTDPRVEKLKEAVTYFYLGTKEGYSNQKSAKGKKGKKDSVIKLASEKNEGKSKNGDTSKKEADLVERIALDLDQLDLSEVAAQAKEVQEEKDEREQNDIEADGEADDQHQQISVVQALASGLEVAPSEEGKYPIKKPQAECVKSTKPIRIPRIPNEIKRTAKERARQGQMCTNVYHILTKGEIKLPPVLESDNESFQAYQVHKFYQPLRQRIYALLFNLHHARYNRREMEDSIKAMRRKADDLRKKSKSESDSDKADTMREEANKLMKEAVDLKLPPEVNYTVREWLPYENYERPDCVDVKELPWAVPTVQKLWFGPTNDDKEKRLRAFLTCMNCDDVRPLLVHANVPQQMLLLAAVLRYMMTSSEKGPVLQKPELDAFLATAFSPELADIAYVREMRLDMVTIRGVHLAALFMQV